MSEQAKRNRLYMQHPDPSPEHFEPSDYLLHPPSRLAPTSAFIKFRDTVLRPRMADQPEDRNFPRYAARVEVVLAWRATIPLEDRFWKEELEK